MSWVPGSTDTPYGVQTLPYGVFVHARRTPAIGVRIGDQVLDLAQVEESGRLDTGGALRQPTLNALMALGRSEWDRVRARTVELLTDEFYAAALTRMLVPLAECRMRLPFEVADYVDFYSSEHHARNVGAIFRPGAPALTPNWKHLPIGYHGRAGTILVSGTPVTRPSGQRMPSGETVPVFGPSVRLDIEAEVGFVVGTPSTLGTPVSVDAFADHVFGVVLVNDWSARDLQAWESVPLGPFLGKSFATSISAWVLPLAALDFARIAAADQQPAVLDYLSGAEPHGYHLAITVTWNGTVVSRPPFSTMYWTPAQQLAHLTVNGASLRTGDLFASGTVSGPERDQTGSFLELTWNGTEPVTLAGGVTRTFVVDGDEIVITATAPGPNGTVVALGEVTGTVVPVMPTAI